MEYLSGVDVMAMLLRVDEDDPILGIGLPTTANYNVVSPLSAPATVSVKGHSGLLVPLAAVHSFVFILVCWPTIRLR